MIEIKHLKTLQALRNSGSLAGAAAALHQTQSALSHQFSDGTAPWLSSLCALEPAAAFYASGGNPLTAGQPGAAADRSRPAGL